MSSPVEALTRLATERDAAYVEVAELVVDVDDLTVADVVDRVVEGLAG